MSRIEDGWDRIPTNSTPLACRYSLMLGDAVVLKSWKYGSSDQCWLQISASSPWWKGCFRGRTTKHTRKTVSDKTYLQLENNGAGWGPGFALNRVVPDEVR